MEMSGISINGHKGTWYVVASGTHQGLPVYLLEHEKYGEDAAALIVNEKCEVLLDDVYNGLSELEEREVRQPGGPMRSAVKLQIGVDYGSKVCDVVLAEELPDGSRYYGTYEDGGSHYQVYDLEDPANSQGWIHYAVKVH